MSRSGHPPSRSGGGEAGASGSKGLVKIRDGFEGRFSRLPIRPVMHRDGAREARHVEPAINTVPHSPREREDMKKQQKSGPGRKLTILRSSEFLRVLGGVNNLGGGSGGPAHQPPYQNPYPTTPTPPSVH